MPIYEYVSEDGDIVEKFFSMKKKPSSITVKGKKYRQKMSTGIQTKKPFESFEVISQPKGFLPDAPVSEKTGRTIITNESELKRASEHILGHKGDQFGYSTDQKG